MLTVLRAVLIISVSGLTLDRGLFVSWVAFLMPGAVFSACFIGLA